MTKLVIQTITADAYHKLTKDAEVLEQDATAPKVLRLTDGSFFKLFRRKRWFSSELIYPYVKRFADNALILNKAAIKTPIILNLYRFSVGELLFTAVRYTPLAGETLRQVMKVSDVEQQKQWITKFAELVANLHQQGIYFRSIHLANVLVLDGAELGLIDFADMTKQNKPLSQNKRARNIKHLSRYKEDAHWLFTEYFTLFLKAYESMAGAKASQFLHTAKGDSSQ